MSDNVEVLCAECQCYFATYASEDQKRFGEVNSECPHCGTVGDNAITVDPEDESDE